MLQKRSHQNKRSRTAHIFLIALLGVRGQCPQNVPPWCADYFELKSMKVQQTQEGYFSPFLKEIQTVKPAYGKEPWRTHLKHFHPSISQEDSKHVY